MPKGDNTRKLTDEQVLEIRKKYNEYRTLVSLAKEYNVCKDTIWRVVNKITHKEV